MHRECLSLDDVMLVPRYSDLGSRKDTYLETCGYSMPIINSPMDLISTQNMLKLFNKNNLMSTVHRYFKSPMDQLEFVQSVLGKRMSKVYFAVGSVQKHQAWIDRLYFNGVTNFLVDMAHGDSQACIDTVKYLRSLPNKSTFGGNNTKIVCVKSIVAGNVATKSAFNRLQDAGASGIRVGVGSGCFTPEMKVKTNNGLTPIKDIKCGDFVYTHTGDLKEVINTIQYQREEEIMIVNNIECTKNHEFYVIDKIHENIVNDENIHRYAKWVSALNLQNHEDEYLFVELD